MAVAAKSMGCQFFHEGSSASCCDGQRVRNTRAVLQTSDACRGAGSSGSASTAEAQIGATSLRLGAVTFHESRRFVTVSRGRETFGRDLGLNTGGACSGAASPARPARSCSSVGCGSTAKAQIGGRYFAIIRRSPLVQNGLRGGTLGNARKIVWAFLTRTLTPERIY